MKKLKSMIAGLSASGQKKTNKTQKPNTGKPSTERISNSENE